MSKEILQKIINRDPSVGGDVKSRIISKVDVSFLKEAKPITVNGQKLDWLKMLKNYQAGTYDGVSVKDLKDGHVMGLKDRFLVYPDIENDKYYIMNVGSETLLDMVSGKDVDKAIDRIKSLS